MIVAARACSMRVGARARGCGVIVIRVQQNAAACVVPCIDLYHVHLPPSTFHVPTRIEMALIMYCSQFYI